MPFAFSPSAGSKIEVTINATFVEIKGAEGIPEFGAEKGTYETTTISDTAKSFGADLADYGEVTLTGIWDSTDAGQAYLLAAAAVASQTDTFKATFTKKSGATNAATGSFSGLVLSFKVAAAKGAPQKFTSKVKLTGAVTWVAQV
jgi:hypothetical protein